MKQYILEIFGIRNKAKARMMPLQSPAQATLPVVRTMTLPGGEKIRVMREDAFRGAIQRKSTAA